MPNINSWTAGGKVTAEMRRDEALDRYSRNPNKCLNCGNIIEIQPKHTAAETRRKKFCSKSCASTYNNRNYVYDLRGEEIPVYLPLRTKGEVFKTSGTWQSARNTIRRQARETYEASEKSKSCIICDYENHYEVCHIKAVKDFDDNAYISEINSLDNLVALCPNHHWEFDNGILKIDSLE